MTSVAKSAAQAFPRSSYRAMMGNVSAFQTPRPVRSGKALIALMFLTMLLAPWLTLCLCSPARAAAQTAKHAAAAASVKAAAPVSVPAPVTATVAGTAETTVPAVAATAATAETAANAATAATASKPAAEEPGRVTSAAPSLQEQIRKLPPITGTDIDPVKRSKEVIDHLNAILRFYRSAVLPVQKTGEPSDVLYAEQSSAQATEIAGLAFQAAKNEAALLSKVAGSAAKPSSAPAAASQPGAPQTQAQRLGAVQAQAQAQLGTLEAQDAALTKQMASARGAQRASLVQQEQQVQGGLELQRAMVEALGRISSFSEAQNSTGLAGDIDRLQRSAPELLASSSTKLPAPGVLQSLAAVGDAGVTTQASALFDLLSTLRSIDDQTKILDALDVQANDLRTPFVKVLRATVAQGNALTQQSVNLPAAATTDAQALADTRKQFDTLTTMFQVLSTATLPLSQEIVLLENSRGTLTTWRSAVNAEYKVVLRHLLLRVLLIGLALAFLAGISQFWSRATVRYVSDLRRRRQLLFVRRAVIGFLTFLVLVFGFVTQFSSLATFAGFISAGIAVGLQTILLSVAAYFFIVGRYGVRVGDRITVAGVTGDVIEVGLVRFYMMELVGTGTELHSTGRVAVFANSVLFQTGTPIYKQMPGTEYAWHELTAKLNGNADVGATTEAISHAISEVYARYSARIEGQHQQVESWVGTALPVPKIESRLQLVDGGLQFAVLFPVELNDAAAADQQIAEELVKSMKSDGPLKAGIVDLPIIKAAVKS